MSVLEESRQHKAGLILFVLVLTAASLVFGTLYWISLGYYEPANLDIHGDGIEDVAVEYSAPAGQVTVWIDEEIAADSVVVINDGRFVSEERVRPGVGAYELHLGTAWTGESYTVVLVQDGDVISEANFRVKHRHPGVSL